MKFLKNRTVLGIVCIALALIICFAITPLFNASKSSTMKIIRIKNDLKIGQEITSKDVETVEVVVLRRRAAANANTAVRKVKIYAEILVTLDMAFVYFL